MAMEDQPTAPDRGPKRDAAAEKAAAARRIAQQSTWVDLQIRQAMARGDFDDLPGYGKPIEDLGGEHDPDWWLKRLIEREHISGVLPPSVQLRKEDAELDGLLDGLAIEGDVRREVEAFNDRVIKARYRPAEGPPLITQPRDIDAEVERWRLRRRELLAARPEAQAAASPPRKRRRRWFSR